MEQFNVYEDMAARTGGEIYIGVVGPVRTGKSSFIKRFMTERVIPNVTGSLRQRMIDELPQSGSGKTVMTTEPKFVPEEGEEVRFKDATAKVRLIDCVGFPVEGANGFEEGGAPRLIRTPWSEEPLPFAAAAEEGTLRVIREHSTIGILVTTDGTVTELPREAYIPAEEKCVAELDRMGKPYLILVNTARPDSSETICMELREKYRAPVVAADVEKLTSEQIDGILERILYEFPVLSVDIDLPDWMRVLDADTPLIAEVLDGVRKIAPEIVKMSDCALLETLFAGSERLLPPVGMKLDLGAGKAVCTVKPQEGAFYQTLSERCGEEIKDDFSLMSYVAALSEAKKLYERVGKAFADAKEYGYGIVPPDRSEMNLALPKTVKKGGRPGVDLHAEAPSYHVIRVDVSGAVRPSVGSAEQSETFVRELSERLEREPQAAWDTNLFGKTLKEVLGEELSVKNRSMAEGVQKKMRKTVTRIVNEGKGGVICILL